MLYAVLCPKACQLPALFQLGQPLFQLLYRDPGVRAEQGAQLILLIPPVGAQQLVCLLGVLLVELVKVGEVEDGHLAAPLEQPLQGADVVLDQGDIEALLQGARGGVEIGDAVVIAADPDQLALRQVVKEGLIPPRRLEGDVALATQQQRTADAHLIGIPVQRISSNSISEKRPRASAL